MKLSFVIPCYRSEKTIGKVIDEICSVMSKAPVKADKNTEDTAKKSNDSEYDFEIICVNDCSPDNVIEVLKDISMTNKKLKVVDFMQNFGKDSALMAGLSFADGDIAVILDDDCQCPADEVFRLIEPIVSGEYDVSSASYKVKKESFFKRMCSEMYRICAQNMLGQPKGVRIENFIAISKAVYTEMLNYKNPYPFLDGLIMRVSRKIAMVPMEERNRGDDNSTGFTFIKSLRMFMDGLTAFSIMPLRIASIAGFITALAGIAYMIFTIVFYFVSSVKISEGYSSLLSVILFIGGMLMMMIGMMGEYIGRIYICINQSPQYVIRKTYNIEK